MPYQSQQQDFSQRFRESIEMLAKASDNFRNLKHYFDTANLKAVFENNTGEVDNGLTLDEIYKALEVASQLNDYMDSNGFWQVVNVLR